MIDILNYFKKFINVGLGKILSISSNFLLLLIITNSFTTENSGLIFLIFSIITFFTSFSRFGQDQVIVKHNNSISGNNSLNTSFFIVLVISSLSFVFIFVLTRFNLIFNDIAFFNFVLLSVIPLSLTWVLIGYFRSNNFQFLSNFSENGIFQFFVVLCFYFITKTQLNLFLVYTICSFLSFIFIFLISYKLGLRISILKTDVFKSLTIGFKIMSSSLLSFLIINLPIYFAGYFNLMEDITVYNVCLRISIVVNVGMAIINSLYSPKYANSFREKDFLSLKKYYRQARLELMFLCFIPFIFVFCFPNTILSYFDIASQTNSLVLRFFIFFQFLCVSTGTTGVFLNIIDKESSLQRNTLIGLIASSLVGLFYVLYFKSIYLMLGMFAVGIVLENFLSYFTVRKFLNEKV
jgi:O-antigen/teichoic acid export membrane protein